MFNKFSEETKRVLALSKQEMMQLNHPYFGSEHILLGILKDNNEVSNVLKKNNITYKKYKEILLHTIGKGKENTKWVLYTPLVKEIFQRALDISDENNSKVTIEDLFVSLIELGDGIATRILKKMNLNIDKIYNEFIFKVPKSNTKKKTIIDEIGVEFTTPNMIETFDPVMGRDKEIKQIIEILIRKNKSNPLLIGDAGVGKTAIIEEISRLIVNNKVPNKLKNKRIINIDMSSAVAGTKYRGEFEEKLNKIIKEAENDDDIILFIDEIHTIVGAGGAEGAIDASNIFKPALARGRIKCIGATTLDEYKKFIEKDKALERRFKRVIIEEVNDEQIKEIMYKLKSTYENFHHVSIDDKLLDLIIELSNKYIYNYKNPDKTIDVLDEVCAHANLKENKKILEYDSLSRKLNEIISLKNKYIINNNFKKAFDLRQEENSIMTKLNNLEFLLSTTYKSKVTAKDVYYVIKNKANIPLLENELNIDELINKLQSVVINQNTAIRQLVNNYFTNKDNTTCFSVVIKGPVGSGKTLLANEFGKLVSNNIIKLNMSEYAESHSISKLIGTSPGYVGYDDGFYIFDSIRRYPFTTIILDGLENAHPKVMELFSEILDSNEIRDSKDNIIKFNNCNIIITVKESEDNKVGFNNKKNISKEFDSSLFNKVDEIIKLEQITRDGIVKIIKKELNSKECDNLNVKYIVNESNFEKEGAKKIKKLINKYKKMKKSIKNYSKN